MAITAELHDGTQLEFPDGTDPAVIQQTVKKVLASREAPPSAPERTMGQKVAQQAGNVIAGGIRGAGSIGATILAPIDVLRDLAAGRGLTLQSNRERRAAMDNALQSLGAEPDSFGYGAGKLAGEVAGTAGAGGALANTLAKVPGVAAHVPNLLEAIRTAGMVSKAQNPVVNALTRAAGGAITGGASAGMVDPETAGTGAVLGGLLPGTVQVAGKLGSMAGKAASNQARKLMQSAVKPTLQQLKSGDAGVAVQTLLDYGLSPTEKGVNQLRTLIDDLNSQVSNKIAASGATVDKQAVLNALGDVRSKFANQVSPTADLAAIQRVADDFAAHPAIVPQIPVQVAQDMKQGTYRVLAGKYGQMGSAETEAQKALARGLKEGVSRAVPEVAALNAEEARLLKTLTVAERRALMDLNKNPAGLATLASSPAGFAAFLADRSAAFKALAARMVNAAGKTAQSQALLSAANNPVLRNAALISAESNP